MESCLVKVSATLLSKRKLENNEQFMVNSCLQQTFWFNIQGPGSDLLFGFIFEIGLQFIIRLVQPKTLVYSHEMFLPGEKGCLWIGAAYKVSTAREVARMQVRKRASWERLGRLSSIVLVTRKMTGKANSELWKREGEGERSTAFAS